MKRAKLIALAKSKFSTTLWKNVSRFLKEYRNLIATSNSNKLDDETKLLETREDGKWKKELLWWWEILYSEAVAQRCSVKKVFLEISQNSQENTCSTCSNHCSNFIKKETLAQAFCNFCKISKNTFSYRTPPMAASKSYQDLENIKCPTEDP